MRFVVCDNLKLRGVNYSKTFGFTIVELLVVIVVIGVLAAITVISYTGISQRARDATLKSDLANAAIQMQLDYTNNGVVSSVLPAAVKYSPGVVMSLSSTGDANTFCVNGQILSGGVTTYMYYDSSQGTVQTGACSGNTIIGSEHGIAQNYVTDNSFTNISNWSLGLSVASDPLAKRAGISTDPIPNKPVLIVSNSISRTTAWAVLYGPISYSNLTNGVTYNRSIWVRKIGGYVGNVGVAGVLDSNGLNVTLSNGVSFAVTTSWQRISASSAALRSGTSGNLYYMLLNTGAFLTTGWTLEFQDPQLTL